MNDFWITDAYFEDVTIFMLIQFIQVVVMKYVFQLFGRDVPGFDHFQIVELRLVRQVGSNDLVCQKIAGRLAADLTRAFRRTDQNIQQLAEILHRQKLSAQFQSALNCRHKSLPARRSASVLSILLALRWIGSMQIILSAWRHLVIESFCLTSLISL